MLAHRPGDSGGQTDAAVLDPERGGGSFRHLAGGRDLCLAGDLEEVGCGESGVAATEALDHTADLDPAVLADHQVEATDLYRPLALTEDEAALERDVHPIRCEQVPDGKLRHEMPALARNLGGPDLADSDFRFDQNLSGLAGTDLEGRLAGGGRSGRRGGRTKRKRTKERGGEGGEGGRQAAACEEGGTHALVNLLDEGKGGVRSAL